LNSRFDWLTYPHDSGLSPNEPIARTFPLSCFLLLSHPIPGLLKREQWLNLGKKYRQRYQSGPDWVPMENDHPHEYPLGPCRVQVVRSCSDWSHGVLKEQRWVHHTSTLNPLVTICSSIQNACEYCHNVGLTFSNLVVRHRAYQRSRALYIYREPIFVGVMLPFDSSLIFSSISSTGESPRIQNLIAQALVERILRAAKEGKRFKVVVLLPEVPGMCHSPI